MLLSLNSTMFLYFQQNICIYRIFQIFTHLGVLINKSNLNTITDASIESDANYWCDLTLVLFPLSVRVIGMCFLCYFLSLTVDT